MIKLVVDNLNVEVPEGSTVLQACEEAGIEIPRFCYHEKLSVAGNCRMCLVELENSPKPIASCAMPASSGMVIKTNSSMVKDARKGVMEFLLINHPLDCPICDQGGECDLQDQAMFFGKGSSRFNDAKRAVSDKNMGPLIKTTMTRCIHCTRCVRFANEVAGVENFGAIGRGENVEITTYLEKAVVSELSGNLVDLCPVGALTSKPYSFLARPWELTKTETIDVMDAVGCNIRVDSRDGKVLRVLPRINEDINEEWISDKSRYAIDGLSKQRLDIPYVKVKNKLLPSSWNDAFKNIKAKLSNISSNQVAAIIGDQTDTESIFALKKLFEKIDSKKIAINQHNYDFLKGNRSNYIFNSHINGIEKCDTILFVGINPRLNAPIVNARIRKNYLNRDIQIASISSEKFDLTYDYNFLGNNIDVLNDIYDQKNEFGKSFNKSNFPMIIIGDEALKDSQSRNIQSVCIEILTKANAFRKDWNGFNIMHNSSSIVGSYDLLNNYSSISHFEINNQCKTGEIKFLFLLGVDENLYQDYKDTFIVYQGHHGDAGAQRANVILPGSAYTEKSASFINLEGRLQTTERAVFPPGDAKEDWAIIRAMSEFLGKKIKYDSLNELRDQMNKEVFEKIMFREGSFNKKPLKGKFEKLNSSHLIGSGRNQYMTCPISRSSNTMAECLK
ncbi:MAG: NADH-quinone oxidoreductase subunit G, partial [SAR116 cluster bacterium]|nr:NADH-quinone oxidoreductase subunit G [SAR116 cluster bacterium]